jgi:hypothetical protein
MPKVMFSQLDGAIKNTVTDSNVFSPTSSRPGIRGGLLDCSEEFYDPRNMLIINMFDLF